MIFWIFVTILSAQRIGELVLARRNERNSRAMGAVEYDRNGYKFIVLMHISFFISLLVEYILLNGNLSKIWIIFLLLFILAQALRYWAIMSLGQYWNTKILVIPGTALVIAGPYKYIRHPNYVAVVTEIAVVPLMFSCYFTAALFTVLNILVLRRRIRIEEKALEELNTRSHSVRL